jgi:hypothetical protein
MKLKTPHPHKLRLYRCLLGPLCPVLRSRCNPISHSALYNVSGSMVAGLSQLLPNLVRLSPDGISHPDNPVLCLLVP